MTEKTPPEYTELLDALDQIPDKYQAEACRELTHDANIIARTLRRVDPPAAS